MKKGLIFIFIITLSLALFSLIVSAAPPFISSSNFNEGYQIKVPPINPVKQNTDFNLNFHVFNISNGMPIDNSSTSCVLHIYLPNGTQIFEGIVPHDTDATVTNEWQILIDKGNFSQIGSHAYNFQCNSSTLGGYESVGFEVTTNGSDQGYTYLIATVVLILIFIIFSLLIQWDKSKMDDEKYWNKMWTRWGTKNYLRFSATAIWYNLKKNSYVLHYLIGLVIMLLVYDVTFVYNLTSVVVLFKVLLTLYLWGSLIVVIVLFGSVQEWLKEWLDSLEKIDWGELTYAK